MTQEPAIVLEPSEPPPPGAGAAREEAAASLWLDAWRDRRRRPLCWIAALVVIAVVSMALFPSLWASGDPLACNLVHGRERPSAAHPFGVTVQGCDMWASVVYGARKSLAVALLATIGTTVVGVVIGGLAGFFSGFVDSALSRVTDVFFGLPFLLCAVVFLAVVPERNVATIAFVIALLDWTTIARVMRGSVLSTKTRDFVDAARGLGASSTRIIRKHVLPNAIAPIIVLTTIEFGVYVVVESTFTFLGVGFQRPDNTWGLLIAEGEPYALEGWPHLLLVPCAFLVVTVLAFIMLGDMLRDALDPRER